MWTVPLPLRVSVSNKLTFSLNLNQYRNAHFQVLNKAKVNFEGLVKPLLEDLPMLNGCTLEYVLYPATRQLCDVSNICSIVDKFFSDTLVSAGKIPDDNYTVVPVVHFAFGAIDKVNPRVEVIIWPFTEPSPMTQKDQPMQITLVQTEVEQALRDYVASRLTLAEGTTFSIDLAATRGANGITATIDLIEPGRQPAPTPAPAKAPVKSTAAPAASSESQTGAGTQTSTTAESASQQPETGTADANPAGEVQEQAAATTGEAQAVPENTGDQPAPAKSLFAGLNRPKNS